MRRFLNNNKGRVCKAVFAGLEGLEARTFYSASTSTAINGLQSPSASANLAQPGAAVVGIAGLTAVSTSSGVVSLSWTTPLSAAGTVSIISTVGRQAFPSLSLAAGATSATIQNVHAGWQIDFQITTGSATSAVATVNVAGSSTVAYSGNPTLQSSAPVMTVATITGLTGVSTSSGVVSLTWTTPLPASGTLSIISTMGRQSFPSLTLAAGATSATIQNVHPGWQIDFQITSGSAISSVATVNVAGSSTVAYSGNPSLQPPVTTPVTTTPVTTTPVTTTPVSTTTTIAGLAGVSTSSGVVSLTWTTPLPATATLSIISTVGRQAFPSLTLAAGSTSATIQNVHPGWELDFQITSGSATSVVATLNVAGSSNAAYSGNPSLGTATPPVTTTPVTTTPVTTTPVTTKPVTTSPSSGTLPDGTPMPNASNTGPTNPNILKPSGPLVVTTAGAVIQNLAISGSLEIKAPNVTVINCTITGNGIALGDAGANALMVHIDSVATNCTIENCSLSGSGPHCWALSSDAGASNLKLLNDNFFNTAAGAVILSDSATIKGSYFHQIGWNALGIASNPLESNFDGIDHVDDIFFECGAFLNVSDNNLSTPGVPTTINGITYNTSNEDIFICPYAAGDVAGPVTINSNYIDGGGFMFALDGQGTTKITNNILGPDEAYPGWIYPNYVGCQWQWSGNVTPSGNVILIPTGLPVAGTA